MGEQARVALQRSASPAALAAIVTSHSDIHDIGTVSPSISEPRQQQIQQIPLWMRWRKFWGVLAIITAIVAVSIWNLHGNLCATLLAHRPVTSLDNFGLLLVPFKRSRASSKSTGMAWPLRSLTS